MPAKRLRGESGYSLVEVMVAMVIMALAILPMIAMFDTGLRSATTGSNYDQARMLANIKLEEAKNLPYDTVRDNFPEPVGTTTTYDGSGTYQSDPKTEPGFPNSMTYVIEKRHMALFPTDSDGSEDFVPSSTNTGLIRVKVTVQWNDNNNLRSFETFGMVAQ
jgi:prepilin-type N-terminal cleavage/methylation domain-containing protein